MKFIKSGGIMSAKKIDARGLSCPQPVIMTQKAVNEGCENIEIIVDTVVSKENVLRTLAKANMKTEVRDVGDEFIIIATS